LAFLKVFLTGGIRTFWPPHQPLNPPERRLLKRQGQGLFFDLWVKGFDFLLNANSKFQGGDNAAVGADIFQLEAPFPSILEPLLTDLISNPVRNYRAKKYLRIFPKPIRNY